jgi:hypothetical protein
MYIFIIRFFTDVSVLPLADIQVVPLVIAEFAERH